MATQSPAAFSYAQAAKGLSSPATTASSKPTSGTNTPKDSSSNSVPVSIPSVPSWADDADAEDVNAGNSPATGENRPQAPPAGKQPAPEPMANGSAVSSPDLGASSASTAVKDDDVASLQNAASESTWENKSQASTSVDKTSEPAETTPEKAEKGKGKGKNSEKVPAKSLQDAPLPSVNPWARRMEEQKAKVAQKPAAKPAVSSAQTNGVGSSDKKNKADEKVASADGKSKPREQEKENQARREESDKAKKGSKGRPYDKDGKGASASLPLPPSRDEESWPTPESAVDEDRKKTQGKPEKGEKERKEGALGSKKEWVQLPYTPTVVFNTPLPGATTRRGGRGGGRGGAQASGRGNNFPAGHGNVEKDAASATLTNGEQAKRGRVDGMNARDSSPKERRAASASSANAKTTVSTEKGSKPAASAESDAHSRNASNATDAAASVAAGQSNSFPRQYPSGRPSKGRRGDFAANGDRRKDGEMGANAKESPGSLDKRGQSELNDSERRSNGLQDGHVNQSKPGQNERRGFSSFGGRERGRGGRGGRGGFPNGNQQFPNGHAPQAQATTFTLPRSPPSFTPEAYFTPTTGPGRPFRANGAGRSHSITNDTVYARPVYPGLAQQLPPIQTFAPPNVYDYMPPATAVPFSPYGVDQWTMINMVSTQMDYYFSVENLCKDIFLRKHMDSQGFVFLSVIADFNRIKHLTTDLNIIKHVCLNLPSIEYRIGVDGKDRLRRRENWEHWVMPMADRDASAQNEGPAELHNPTPPAFAGFEHPMMAHYPDMPLNGVPHPGNGEAPVSDGKTKGNTTEPAWTEAGFVDRSWENGTHDQAFDAQANGVNGFAGSNGQTNGVNGHSVDGSTNNA